MPHQQYAERLREMAMRARDASASWECIARQLETLDKCTRSKPGPATTRFFTQSNDIAMRMIESLRTSSPALLDAVAAILAEGTVTR